MEPGVDHVADLLAGRKKDKRAQVADGPLGLGAIGVLHGERRVVGRTVAQHVLQSREPAPGQEPTRREPRRVDVHVRRLVDREGEAGDLVVGDRCAHAEVSLVHEQRRRRRSGIRRRRQFERRPLHACEPGRRRELPAPAADGGDLGHVEDEGIPVGEIPDVAAELAGHAVADPLGAVQEDAAVAVQEEAQQPVEPDEVVHVGVRHEHVRHLEEFRRGQPVVATEVEEHGRSLPAELDEQSRVTERAVHQPGGEGRRHERFLARAPRRRTQGHPF